MPRKTKAAIPAKSTPRKRKRSSGEATTSTPTPQASAKRVKSSKKQRKPLPVASGSDGSDPYDSGEDAQPTLAMADAPELGEFIRVGESEDSGDDGALPTSQTPSALVWSGEDDEDEDEDSEGQDGEEKGLTAAQLQKLEEMALSLKNKVKVLEDQAVKLTHKVKGKGKNKSAEQPKAETEAALLHRKRLISKGRGGTSVCGADVDPSCGVIYLGHIPYGFFEDQMRGFFSQFGTVTRIRLSRSKKTGRSRGFGFVEFKSPVVADIVADTMNGYMMFGRTLQCHTVQPEKLHPDVWKGANRKFRRMPVQRIQRDRHNKKRTPEEERKRVQRLLVREQKKRKKLQALGIAYEFPGYASQVTSSDTQDAVSGKSGGSKEKKAKDKKKRKRSSGAPEVAPRTADGGAATTDAKRSAKRRRKEKGPGGQSSNGDASKKNKKPVKRSARAPKNSLRTVRKA